MIQRWMYVTLFPAFIYVYTNPIDCDFEKDSCSWSIDGFRRISYNQINGIRGWNNHLDRNDCNFLDGLCNWEGYGWTVPTGNFNYTVTECKSLRDQSLLYSVSEIYPGEKCLSFKYQTNDLQRGNIYIDVHSYNENQMSTIWTGGWQQQFQGWKEISADINLRNKSRISIRFAYMNCFKATFYINRISLKKQSCTATDSSSSTSTTKSNFINSETDASNSSATTICIGDDTSCTTAEATPTPSTETEHIIIGIGIIVVIAVIVIAAVCYYRKKQRLEL
ncbi:hypothetical protein CHS0354_030239 [Potamilus streckersoni]|uniref:MAM domain-containing protein n=1 Tax=Potamilus streckersoni TaxID=2493646 RepID=A0AAE0RSI4_9BIVA|nr:hypothetical protein CHS0354_030239 [Potamilus streckersoni]